jgi:hypothetical protein
MFHQKHAVHLLPKAAAVLVACIAITACGVHTPTTPSTKTSTGTSESRVPNEAVSESTRSAYKNFLQVADQILTDGGTSPERIETVTTRAFAEIFTADVVEYATAGLRTVGSTETQSFNLQSWSTVDRKIVATTYVCDDVSGIDVLNSEGASIVSSDRDATTPYVVAFEGDALDELVVSAKDHWTGADFCDG